MPYCVMSAYSPSAERGDVPPLEDREVHLWRIDLHGAPWLDTEAILDTSERDRAARFVFPRDRSRYLCAHHAVRVLLGAYLNVPPAVVRIVPNHHGKPMLNDHALGFNLSHSGDCALLAVSRVAEIGVDVEMLRLPREARQLAESVFSAAELETLSNVSDDALETAFFTCWTRKEAYLKALGIGLTANPATITVGLETGLRRIEIAGRDAHQFVDVVSIADHSDRAAAIAVVGGYSSIRIFDYAHRLSHHHTDMRHGG